jgi:serine/threonine-protein kinase
MAEVNVMAAATTAAERCPRCDAPNPGGRLSACPACLFDPPPRLGGVYEMEEAIGRGASGTVYRARHTRLDRTVAVKVLAEPLAAHPDVEERFEAEARMMALLEHPRIVAVHDVGRDSGHSYIVMELVEGTPLSALMPLPPSRALGLILQVCEALAFAHERGVVHGDVKPANVLVEPDGSVKLSDFGVARLVDAPAARGLVAGTRAYMAPEALNGAEPDPRMDVYSAAVLLHELLTGRRPDAGGPGIGGALGTVLARALDARPSRRQPDAGALRRDLARVAQEGGAATLKERKARWVGVGAALNALLSVVALRALVDGAAAAAAGLLSGLDAVDTIVAAGGPLLAGLSMIALAGLVTVTLDYRWQDEGAPAGAPAQDGWLLPAAVVALAGGLLRAALPLLGIDLPVGVLRPAADLAQLGAAVAVWRELLDARRRDLVAPARLGWRLAAALTAASFLSGLAVLLA